MTAFEIYVAFALQIAVCFTIYSIGIKEGEKRSGRSTTTLSR